MTEDVAAILAHAYPVYGRTRRIADRTEAAEVARDAAAPSRVGGARPDRVDLIAMLTEAELEIEPGLRPIHDRLMRGKRVRPVWVQRPESVVAVWDRGVADRRARERAKQERKRARLRQLTAA